MSESPDITTMMASGMTYEEIQREVSIDLMLDVHIATHNAVIKQMTPEEEQVERVRMRNPIGVLYDTGDDDAAIDAMHDD